MDDAVDKPKRLLQPLMVTPKTMMGPGPTNCSPRVLHALSQPLLGHVHKEIFQIMDDVKSGLRYVFQTRNSLTLAVSATGHGGMEAAMCNLVEPGDKVLVADNGIWGRRAADVARRHGAVAESVAAEPGANFRVSRLAKEIATRRPRIVFVVQGESSTGVHQPIEGLGRICRKYDCLLVVDAVASLGAVDLFTDRWLVDCVYSGSQKVLGSPPGLAPISFGPRATKKIRDRRSPVSVFYFDMNWLGRYWGCFPELPRVYHHTISATLLYGLREALAQVVEEGLGECIARHRAAAAILHDGLRALGLEFFVPDPDARLPTVTTVRVPRGMDWKQITEHCLYRDDVEISGGLGPTAGKVLRIGVMGHNARAGTVELALNALKRALASPTCKL